jgi:imidazolonepropionase-like amidohydrolase
MRLPLALVALLALAAGPGTAQDGPPPNGPRPVDPGWHALVGARILIAPDRALDRGTVLIRDGRIEAVEAGAVTPPGARVHDCEGLTIHAAWIDAHLPVAAPRPAAGAPGAHWHPDVLPQRSALDGAGVDADLAAELRGLGFGAAGIHPADGIVRGRGAVVTLEDPAPSARRRILAEQTLQTIALDRAVDGYPRALMGSVALVRQALADAAQQSGRAPGPETAIGALLRTPATLFVSRDELDALRGARILAEAGRVAGSAILGSGTEFRRLDAIAALGLPIVLPLAFPDPPEVETLRGAESVDLRQMWTWEQAPTNPARLRRAGVTIALTSDRLEERSRFLPALRRAIEHGLPPEDALAALTTAPAALLGVAGRLGTVEAGKLANLCVVDGEPFAAERVLRAVWVGGVEHRVTPAPSLILAGTWDANLRHGELAVSGLVFADERRLELVVDAERRTKARSLHRSTRQLDLTFDAGALGGQGIWSLTALVQGDRMSGLGVAADGARFAWTARRSAAAPAAADEPPRDPDEIAERAGQALPLPFGAFGRAALPPQQTVRVRGATIWTSGPAGIVADGVLLVADGRVRYAGPAAAAPDLPVDLEIDGRGLHLTPGLIDCHSHTGIQGGVNEGTQAVTAEVRIGDVLDPDDINWYRQLAGGITAVHQLHGSANPIGGQSQVVKLRWGVRDPEQMKLEGSRPGIKFALGENVKRSRSSGDNTRYPNTRMGVEALLRDRFTAAREYIAAQQRARQPGAAPGPGRDLELEALAEILRGERLVHCHSYRQDEILMLCRLAAEFGFRIGTFQHGLEGYKVAEAIRSAAIGASVFSDWWAYKYEVVDAIPENAAIMTRVGVNVSFNSDSNELARRMNTEAAKAVKYGGLAPAEALHLVTINPAIQLAADQRIGSLETGKDGDFVIWSGDPLSAFTRCLETWIEGRRYWSEAADLEARQAAGRERARLIQAILATPGARAGADRDPGLDNRPGDCECLDSTGLERSAAQALLGEVIR